MKTEKVKLTQIAVNDANPRVIKDHKFNKLVNSILVLPKMLEIRPIVVDNTMVALGGNMRFRALSAIADMESSEIARRLDSLGSYQRKTQAEQEQLIASWEAWQDAPTAYIIKASELTDAEQQEFIIKDNVGFGEWDMDMLANEWDDIDLTDWGVDLGGGDKEKTITETEKLSELKFNGMYYEPKNKPELSLQDCVDLEKFKAKMKVIQDSPLSDGQKELMTLFAYRFIKINFEAVANYYAFNATEDEKKVIERLRMVLVDGSIDGFIEDDLIRIREDVMSTDSSWQTEHSSVNDYE